MNNPENKNELETYKDELRKLEKEQLIDLVVNQTVQNYALETNNKGIKTDFINAVTTMSNNTVGSLDNINETIKLVMENVPKLKAENVALWITVAVEAIIIISLFFRR